MRAQLPPHFLARRRACERPLTETMEPQQAAQPTPPSQPRCRRGKSTTPRGECTAESQRASQRLQQQGRVPVPSPALKVMLCGQGGTRARDLEPTPLPDLSAESFGSPRLPRRHGSAEDHLRSRPAWTLHDTPACAPIGAETRTMPLPATTHTAAAWHGAGRQHCRRGGHHGTEHAGPHGKPFTRTGADESNRVRCECYPGRLGGGRKRGRWRLSRLSRRARDFWRRRRSSLGR